MTLWLGTGFGGADFTLSLAQSEAAEQMASLLWQNNLFILFLR
jgi:hypothetical protein